MSAMRFLRRLLCLSVSAIIVISLLAGATVGQVVDNVAGWTVAIYMDSDNDLDIWAQEDVNQMLTVSSTGVVNIVLLWDTETGPAYAYHVLNGELVDLEDFELYGIETNMGDESTLRKFVSYTTSNFESHNFMLVLWDHGDDSLGVCFDYHPGVDGDMDYLTHKEVVSALSGFRTDVLLFAACVLAMIEVAYEYCESNAEIDYIVASEGYDPMPGFPWDAILTELVSQPDMTSLTLATILVDEHLDYYAVKHWAEDGPHPETEMPQSEEPGTAWWWMSYEHVTFSVLEVSRMREVVSDMSDLVWAIIPEMDEYATMLSEARTEAILPWSQNGWERSVDLPRLVGAINDRTSGTIASSCEDVLQSISEAVVYHRTLDERSGYEGMGIFFPMSLAMYENCQVYYGQWPVPQWSEYYGQMLFADEMWLDFLNAYWNSAPPA